MKKWLILILIAVLLTALGLCAFELYNIAPSTTDRSAVTAEPTALETQPVQSTQSAQNTVPPPTETTCATLPALPAAVMPADYLLTATHAFVYDCGSEEMVFTMGNQEESIAPASLTKLLTIYVALQHLSPETVVTAGEEVTWVDPASSLATVKNGDTLTVSLLIEGMMLQSGNDAAYVLAVATGRVIAGEPQLPAGLALDAFMEDLNARAALLGLEHTYFITPDGLDAEGHRSSPSDMLKLTRLIMEEPLLMQYAATAKDTVTFTNGITLDWTNTNYLLHPESPYYCPEACGLKTGYTSKAGACLIALFYTGDRYLIVGIFGAPHYEDRAADALFLYEQHR